MVVVEDVIVVVVAVDVVVVVDVAVVVVAVVVVAVVVVAVVVVVDLPKPHGKQVGPVLRTSLQNLPVFSHTAARSKETPSSLHGEGSPSAFSSGPSCGMVVVVLVAVMVLVIVVVVTVVVVPVLPLLPVCWQHSSQ